MDGHLTVRDAGTLQFLPWQINLCLPLGKAKIPSVVYAWWCQFWNFLTQFDHFVDLNAISCMYKDPLAVRKILHGAVAGRLRMRFIGMNQSRWILSFLYSISLFYYFFFSSYLKYTTIRRPHRENFLNCLSWNNSTARIGTLSIFLIKKFHFPSNYIPWKLTWREINST